MGTLRLSCGAGALAAVLFLGFYGAWQLLLKGKEGPNGSAGKRLDGLRRLHSLVGVALVVAVPIHSGFHGGYGVSRFLWICWWTQAVSGLALVVLRWLAPFIILVILGEKCAIERNRERFTAADQHLQNLGCVHPEQAAARRQLHEVAMRYTSGRPSWSARKKQVAHLSSLIDALEGVAPRSKDVVAEIGKLRGQCDAWRKLAIQVRLDRWMSCIRFLIHLPVTGALLSLAVAHSVSELWYGAAGRPVFAIIALAPAATVVLFALAAGGVRLRKSGIGRRAAGEPPTAREEVGRTFPLPGGVWSSSGVGTADHSPRPRDQPYPRGSKRGLADNLIGWPAVWVASLRSTVVQAALRAVVERGARAVIIRNADRQLVAFRTTISQDLSLSSNTR